MNPSGNHRRSDRLRDLATPPQYAGVICDLDGTVYLSGEPFPGVVDAHRPHPCRWHPGRLRVEQPAADVLVVRRAAHRSRRTRPTARRRHLRRGAGVLAPRAAAAGPRPAARRGQPGRRIAGGRRHAVDAATRPTWSSRRSTGRSGTRRGWRRSGRSGPAPGLSPRTPTATCPVDGGEVPDAGGADRGTGDEHRTPGRGRDGQAVGAHAHHRAATARPTAQ